MSEVRAMEHGTLKVPYEVINKKFRLCQKTLDREVSQYQNATAEVERYLQPGTPVGEIRRLLGGVVERLQTMKRKSNESLADELAASYVCKRRLEHLKESAVSDQSSNFDVYQANIGNWKSIRLDRMVIEHCLRFGFYESAEKLANRTGIKDLTNLEIFQIARDVEQDLRERKTAKCIMWCNENKSKLRKINSTLEFQLRVQEFVELIREQNRMEAVKFARKHFPAFQKEQLNEICQCMALLAFPLSTELEPYKGLFNPNRWHELVLNFRNENYRLFNMSTQSLLGVTIQAGLSALKTPQCYSANSRNNQCPVCVNDFNEVAKSLPFSHCAQSRLICRVTGLPLNEHNLPMMLPNGQIYGQLAIPQITKADGTVVCPITKEPFVEPKIEKVYIM